MLSSMMLRLTALRLSSTPVPRVAAYAVSGSSQRCFANKIDTSEDKKHQEWVQFQQSIAVEGFETGQETEIKKAGKRRGGKKFRKKHERELARKAAEKNDMIAGGGEFPPEVFSDEETEALLKEAWGNLPERTGKRGTNHLKREKLRWGLKRANDAKKKRERIIKHEDTMARRSAVAHACRSIRETAEDVRQAELEYREKIYRQWASNMVNAKNEKI